MLDINTLKRGDKVRVFREYTVIDPADDAGDVWCSTPTGDNCFIKSDEGTIELLSAAPLRQGDRVQLVNNELAQLDVLHNLDGVHVVVQRVNPLSLADAEPFLLKAEYLARVAA